MSAIELFHNEIIQEAKTGRVFSGLPYNVAFNTNGKIVNDEYPNLAINNKKEFDYVLNNYVESAKNFYRDDNFEDINFKEKTILTLLWANATDYDFNYPIQYIERYTNFIKNNPFENVENLDLGYISTLDSHLYLTVSDEKVYQETPHSFNLSIRKTIDDYENRYDLPKVRYGIDGEVGYIYAIQKEDFKPSSYTNKINRLLYKVNANFVDIDSDINNITNPGNLTGVTPSTLLSMVITIGLLKNRGINKIMMPDFLPVRYNSKVLANKIRAKRMASKENKDEKEILEALNKMHENILRNTTDKFIRTARRVEYHFDNANITLYPREIDAFLHMDVYGDMSSSNALLSEVYDASLNVKISIYK